MALELHPSLDGVCRWQVLTKSNGLATCSQGICLKEFVSREFVSVPDPQTTDPLEGSGRQELNLLLFRYSWKYLVPALRVSPSSPA